MTTTKELTRLTVYFPDHRPPFAGSWGGMTSDSWLPSRTGILDICFDTGSRFVHLVKASRFVLGVRVNHGIILGLPRQYALWMFVQFLLIAKRCVHTYPVLQSILWIVATFDPSMYSVRYLQPTVFSIFMKYFQFPGEGPKRNSRRHVPTSNKL